MNRLQKIFAKGGEMTRASFGFEWAYGIQEGISKNLNTLSCVEIIPENFFDGRYSDFLTLLKAHDTPVAVHGVLLSLGTSQPLDEDHLNRVLEIGSKVNMVNFSEHLSMTTVDGIDLDALTPIAFTQDVADEICRKIDKIQNRLKVPFLIENVSNRFMIPNVDYSESEFINYILRKTGCGLLLDVTNVFTNSVNFNFDPNVWIDEVNLDSVQLVHLAGGHYDPDGFLMDSHDNTISQESWSLYSKVCKKSPSFMTIIERTSEFPNFDELRQELERAQEIAAEVAA